jgi:hypothetical protein
MRLMEFDNGHSRIRLGEDGKNIWERDKIYIDIDKIVSIENVLIPEGKLGLMARKSSNLSKITLVGSEPIAVLGSPEEIVMMIRNRTSPSLDSTGPL